ncbi:ankyrin repeat-containing domain protein [Lactifluus volemus]|nr:ankyrin repeat-containing domain protein [Lactifluus volemus]
MRGNLETVQILLRFPGKTPLHYASERGHLDVVRLLLGSGADVNARMDDGSTPLHVTPCRAGDSIEVADEDDKEMIKLLSEHIAK